MGCKLMKESCDWWDKKTNKEKDEINRWFQLEALNSIRYFNFDPPLKKLPNGQYSNRHKRN